jgi:glutathione synthase/RimK-type ligase-like ATP-grasp enzyme
MIVAIGVDVDDTFATFVKNALDAGTEPLCVNLRVAVDGAWRFDLPAKAPARLLYAGEEISLSPDDAYYCRLIDLSSGAEPLVAKRWQGLMTALRVWLEAAPGRVVNRPSGGLHNSSKPLHEAVLRGFGLSVPESITSSNPQTLRAFAREGPTISKAVCGVRADTIMVTEEDLAGFDSASGPAHLQRLVAGDDARIHVVGAQVVAQRVEAGAVDYRRDGALARMTVFDPPGELRDQLIESTAALGLAFAGWDFKIDAAGDYWCLEANPMPGYGPYDAHCDGAISRALRHYLDSEPR